MGDDEMTPQQIMATAFYDELEKISAELGPSVAVGRGRVAHSTPTSPALGSKLAPAEMRKARVAPYPKSLYKTDAALSSGVPDHPSLRPERYKAIIGYTRKSVPGSTTTHHTPSRDLVARFAPGVSDRMGRIWNP